MQHLDHGAISLLIAGTFMAIHGGVFRGFSRWGVLMSIWTFAATAVNLMMTFFDDAPEWPGLSMYLAMGWVGLLSGYLLGRCCGSTCVRLLLLSGVAYTPGAVLDAVQARSTYRRSVSKDVRGGGAHLIVRRFP